MTATKPRKSPHEIAEMMVGQHDNQICFRDGTCVRHGYPVDEALRIYTPANDRNVAEMRRRIANLVQAVRDESKDLLAACEAMIGAFGDMAENLSADSIGFKAVAAAEAAIAKAKGK